MAAKIIDGRKIAEKIKKQVKEEVKKLFCQKKIIPGLAVILIGHNQASFIYTKIKERACEKAGIYFEKYYFKKISQKELITLIKKLNKAKNIHGILVQLPLPKYLNENKIIKTINPQKDVDGFHPENLKKILKGKAKIIPPTIAGIIKLIESSKINLKNKRALIIANSQIFAKPLIKILKDKKIKAEYCSGKDKKLKEKSSQADVLIVALGKPNFITAQMVKKDSIIIDVGYNRIKGKSVGDVDFTDIFPKASYITPVPGGVGPMTVAMLLKNVLELAK